MMRAEREREKNEQATRQLNRQKATKSALGRASKSLRYSLDIQSKGNMSPLSFARHLRGIIASGLTERRAVR